MLDAGGWALLSKPVFAFYFPNASDITIVIISWANGRDTLSTSYDIAYCMVNVRELLVELQMTLHFAM